MTDADRQEVKSILYKIFEDVDNPRFRGVIKSACLIYPGFKRAIEDAFAEPCDDDGDNDDAEDTENDSLNQP